MLACIIRVFGCDANRSYDYSINPAEVEAIKQSWNRAKKRDIGQKILAALIERKPQFKEYFHIKVDDSDTKLLYGCEHFQIQARRIQSFLNTVVSSLGLCPITTIHDMARRIGKIHFQRGVNFGADNWLVFKNVTIDQVIMKHSFSQSSSLSSIKILEKKSSRLELALVGRDPGISLIAWEKLMGCVIREMKRGFLEEAMKNCTIEDTVD